jgi:predicted nucleic acid-binding protein
MKNRKGPTKAQLNRAREKWIAISKADSAWKAIERADEALRAAFGVATKYRKTVVDRLCARAAQKKARVASVVSLVSRLKV